MEKPFTIPECAAELTRLSGRPECSDSLRSKLSRVTESLKQHHPVSAEYFGFLQEGFATDENMGPILRMFLVAEHDRDPSILDRFEKHLDEYREAVTSVRQQSEEMPT